MNTAPAHLAENVRNLRQTRGLSQAQIAETAGIPRATWGHLESGAANPTLSVLVKVAAALQVRLEELLSAPTRAGQHHRADTLPLRVRGDVHVRKLLPEPLAGLDIERVTFPAGATLSGVPHTPGTREYLTCERGRIELRVAGETHVLEPGDVVVFRGDQRHGYRNVARGESIAYSVIAFAPSGT